MVVGLPLLPASFLAPLLAAALVVAPHDRFAERGTRETVAIDRDEPPLVASGRRLVLHGFAPANERAPLVVIAARSGAPATIYDPLARHLATHGFTALVVARKPDEVWSRYSDALDLAVRQLRYEAEMPDHPWSRIVDPGGPAIVADGDAEAAAARAAATITNVRALVLVDGDDSGAALPWLDRSKAPFLFVGASELDTEALPGLPSFNASGAEGGRRWHVRLRAAGPLVEGAPGAGADASSETSSESGRPSADAEPDVRPVVHDCEALVARFLEAQLGPARDPASLRDLVKLGLVDRDCRCGIAAAPPRTAKRR